MKTTYRKLYKFETQALAEDWLIKKNPQEKLDIYIEETNDFYYNDIEAQTLSLQSEGTGGAPEVSDYSLPLGNNLDSGNINTIIVKDSNDELVPMQLLRNQDASKGHWSIDCSTLEPKSQIIDLDFTGINNSDLLYGNIYFNTQGSNNEVTIGMTISLGGTLLETVDNLYSYLSGNGQSSINVEVTRVSDYVIRVNLTPDSASNLADQQDITLDNFVVFPRLNVYQEKFTYNQYIFWSENYNYVMPLSFLSSYYDGVNVTYKWMQPFPDSTEDRRDALVYAFNLMKYEYNYYSGWSISKNDDGITVDITEDDFNKNQFAVTSDTTSFTEITPSSGFIPGVLNGKLISTLIDVDDINAYFSKDAIITCKSDDTFLTGDYCRPTSDGSGLIELFPYPKFYALGDKNGCAHPIWEVVSQDVDKLTHIRLVNPFYSAFEDIYAKNQYQVVQAKK